MLSLHLPPVGVQRTMLHLKERLGVDGMSLLFTGNCELGVREDGGDGVALGTLDIHEVGVW